MEAMAFVSILLSCHIAAPSTALLLVVSRPIRSWRPPLHHSSIICSSSLPDADLDLTPYSSLRDIPALQRLNLTADEIAVIATRLNGITPRKRRHRNFDDGDDHENLEVSFAGRSQTMERNIAYLEDRLDLNVEGLRRIVVGYPRLLSLSLENDLMHTIDFFDDALPRTTNDRNRLTSLLCEMPSLMEYNVAKRLRPRIRRVRSSLLGRDACVDSEMSRTLVLSLGYEAYIRMKKMPMEIGTLTISNSNQQTGNPTTRLCMLLYPIFRVGTTLVTS